MSDSVCAKRHQLLGRDIEHNYRAPKYVTVQWVKERDAGQEAQA